MTRQRSPSYPAISIDQAIDFIGKIHKSCRANVIDRETAAREMGYSGLTGRSMKVIADLIQFGLLEKTGKGDVKVTQLAVDILHGIDPKDREQAKLEAALSPQLFKDIHERFPDGIPSENAIRSFLIQQDFQDAAISPAITAFMETYRAVENIRENESHGGGGGFEPESQASTKAMDEAMNAHVSQPAAHIGRGQPRVTVDQVANEFARYAAAQRQLEPNEVYLDFLGSRSVHVEGVLDYNGILELEEKIKAVKMLLKKPEKGDVGVAIEKGEAFALPPKTHDNPNEH